MKKYLYIDCDGVILDTVTYAFKEMKELGVDLTNQDAITNYFKNVNWQDLIDQGGILNNSLEKIMSLKDSQEFESVIVLTHRCSFNEGVVKTNNFNQKIPGVKVITVPKIIKKNFAVKPEGNFLIDDDIKKITDWVNDGGIGIWFNQDVNCLIYPFELNNNQPYFITNNLLDLLKINEYFNEKIYIKK